MPHNSAEAPLPPSTNQSSEDFSLQAYEQNLHDNGVRTGRHASEIGHAPPEEDIKLATVGIRRVIAPAFAVESEASYNEETTLDAMKRRYWERASRVTKEHGAIEGFGLEDYFATSEKRSYYSLKHEIEDRYSEESVGRTLLDAVETYHQSLDINPAHATTILCELISKGRGQISTLATQYSDMPPEEATRRAFRDFTAAAVPAHIISVLEQHGQGDAVVAAHTKQSFYPHFEEASGVTPLTFSHEDVRGFIDVFDIQNRPYNRAELRMADDIAKIPAMQEAMLGVHERLMDMSQSYLAKNPERMNGDMASWSEIFVPEKQPDGNTELLPNPKLMRAITNNVLPAVAGQLIERGADIDEITVEDITEGTTIAARTYKLLQSKIGLFHVNPQTGKVELGNITSVICPANQAFPSFLMQYLGPDYVQLAELERSRK